MVSAVAKVVKPCPVGFGSFWLTSSSCVSDKFRVLFDRLTETAAVCFLEEERRPFNLASILACSLSAEDVEFGDLAEAASGEETFSEEGAAKGKGFSQKSNRSTTLIV